MRGCRAREGLPLVPVDEAQRAFRKAMRGQVKIATTGEQRREPIARAVSQGLGRKRRNPGKTGAGEEALGQDYPQPVQSLLHKDIHKQRRIGRRLGDAGEDDRAEPPFAARFNPFLLAIPSGCDAFLQLPGK